MNWQGDVLVAAVVAGLVELVLHWFPWRLLLGRDLPRLGAYSLGTMGVAGPLNVLLWHWWATFMPPGFPLPVSELVIPQVVLARVLWAELWVTAAAGGAVFGAYGLDWVLLRVRRSYELQELMDGRQVE